tara:strand:+ start:2262 stop:2441 length:180 start_codon:yes stop_codon:yes gene_type:complete
VKISDCFKALFNDFYWSEQTDFVELLIIRFLFFNFDELVYSDEIYRCQHIEKRLTFLMR